MRLEDQKKAKKLRSQGWTLPEIAAEVKAGKGLVSLWVRDVQISKAGKDRLAKRNLVFGGKNKLEHARKAWSNQKLAERIEFRQQGRNIAKMGEPLHIMACSLYWAEGSKPRNTAAIINGDLNVLRVFLSFCKEYFGVSGKEITYKITGYTNLHTAEEMKDYWVKGLRLQKSNQRLHCFDDFRYKTRGVSGKRVGKLPYGMCTIYIKNSTRVVQHIYGALEVYGGTIIDPKR